MKNNNINTLLYGFAAGIVGSALLLLIAAAILWQNRIGFIHQLSKNYYGQSQNDSFKSFPGDNGKAILFPQETLVVEAVNKANPAVVSIVISKDVPIIIERYHEESPFNDFFGDEFFNFSFPQYRENGTERREVGGGSGFLVSSDGYIATNRHVVDDKKAEYTVFTNDGEKHEAKVVARDPVFDLAVIKIEGGDYPFLEFGDSDVLQVGQSVIAIGNALAEFRNTVSVGVISGLARSIVAGDGMGRSEQLDQVIQTDAAINPGNSGGPLLNLKGQVVGINVAVVQGSENIGFALPSNSAKGVIESVKKTGKIIRPQLGVRYIQITPEIAKKNNLTVEYGALISRGETREDLAVLPGSPADKAGLVENDIIMEIDGVKLTSEKNLSSIIRIKNVDDIVELKVLHKGSGKKIRVKLEAIPQ